MRATNDQLLLEVRRLNEDLGRLREQPIMQSRPSVNYIDSSRVIPQTQVYTTPTVIQL